MKKYGNTSGNSGILAYEIQADRILIKFSSGDTYVYSYKKPGKADVEEMKALAESGEGLATYINQHVRERYDYKL
ncbi:MAG TPA: hypothetical protein VD993_20325 [Chitinophagaceae bacterium]|nr:hypothetical protein [Chitinophagaceae bacterium]